MYCNMKITIETKSFFDPSLTPINAQKKGYNYIDDVIYDFLNPNETMKDILEFLHEFHGKLGTPANDTTTEQFFGLYMPV